MSDHPMYESAAKNGAAFPMLIALTALVLAITSGVVNYRQNNLSNLESSMRDTRDQLQLAKNDITDIKVKTVKQLVDAEFVIKNQQHVKQENQRLHEELADARTRIGELEDQIRSMDHKLMRAMASLKSGKKKPGKVKTASPELAPVQLPATVASADLDIFTWKIAASLQQSIGKAMSKDGFKPKFPVRPASMGLSKATTVFYYDAGYKPVAEKLVTSLAAITHGTVTLRKGASPYPNNKIIVHLIGN